MPPKIANPGAGEDAAAAAAAGDAPAENTGRSYFRAPAFWRSNPALWFAQLEAQFASARIVADMEKYNAIVAAIESSVLAQVSDIILGPAENRTYQVLKDRLISAFADSEQRRMQKLLSEIGLDDKRPSQLLREMRELAGAAVPDDLLKTLWVKRLSPQTQAILSANQGDLANLAGLADKIVEVTQPSTVSELKKPNSCGFDELKLQIAALSEEVSKLRASRGEGGGRSRSQSNRRSKSNGRSKSSGRSQQQWDDNKCFYHNRFGANAHKCRPPCTDSGNELAGR